MQDEKLMKKRIRQSTVDLQRRAWSQEVNHLLKQLEIIDREPSHKETICQRLVSLLQYTLKAKPDDRPIIASNLRDLQGDIENPKTGVTAKPKP